MLINVSQPEECRIALIEDGVLEELYVERASQDNYVGNIYKGRIVNLEPSIQAAFVDFGVGRNGFLHISDVEPHYFRQGGFDPSDPDVRFGSRHLDVDTGEDSDEDNGDDDSPRSSGGGPRSRRRGPRPGARPRIKPPIQEIFRRGDEVLVQVIKEGIGTKGPTLSTYISIPGRYLVLMPALGRVGVSRKIEDDEERRKLREILLELNPPKGLGFIVRTAGQGRSRRELSRDLAYLLRLWKVIVRRLRKSSAPIDIYEESDMIIRTIRDIFTTEVDSIYVDEKAAFDRAKDFLQLVMPRHVHRLHLYEGREPLFHRYKLEDEIGRIYKREVPLREGGSIVIDQTEALVAIDVNSGNFRTDDSAEESAYRLNLAAAKEIARQLRLRDLGGVIVNDFIDMRREKHRRGVERALRDAMKRDRARTKILRTSPFGLIEMTRQRIRPSLKKSVYADCPCCGGRGVVKKAESMAIEVVRLLMLAGQEPRATRVTVRVNVEVAAYLNNRKRREIMRLEEDGNMTIQILGSEAMYPEHLEIDCRDADGREIELPQ
jgi:ribonuclease E